MVYLLSIFITYLDLSSTKLFPILKYIGMLRVLIQVVSVLTYQISPDFKGIKQDNCVGLINGQLVRLRWSESAWCWVWAAHLRIVANSKNKELQGIMMCCWSSWWSLSYWVSWCELNCSHCRKSLRPCCHWGWLWFSSVQLWPLLWMLLPGFSVAPSAFWHRSFIPLVQNF